MGRIGVSCQRHSTFGGLVSPALWSAINKLEPTKRSTDYGKVRKSVKGTYGPDVRRHTANLQHIMGWGQKSLA